MSTSVDVQDSKRDAGHVKSNAISHKPHWAARCGRTADKSAVASAAAAVAVAAAAFPRHRHRQHRHKSFLRQHHSRHGSSSGSSGGTSKYSKPAAAGPSSATLASLSRRGLLYSSSAHSRHSSRTVSVSMGCGACVDPAHASSPCYQAMLLGRKGAGGVHQCQAGRHPPRSYASSDGQAGGGGQGHSGSAATATVKDGN